MVSSCAQCAHGLFAGLGVRSRLLSYGFLSPGLVLLCLLILMAAAGVRGVSCLMEENKVQLLTGKTQLGTNCVSYIAESKKKSDEQSPLFESPLKNILNFFMVGKGEKKESREYKDKYGEWRTAPGCGDYIPVYMCENPECRKPHYIKHRCLRKACPDCYQMWLAQTINAVEARLFSKIARSKHEGKRLVSIVLSPRHQETVYSKEELNKLIREGYAYIKGKGALGGVMIFHPFRATKEAKRLSRAANMKVWKWIRKQEVPWVWYRYSPHLHLVCYVNYLKPPKKNEKWIYKMKTDKKGKVIDLMQKSKGRADLRGLSGYLLTHTGDLPREDDHSVFDSVRWFGSCGFNQFKTTEEELGREEKPEETLTCKVCGALLVPFWRGIRDYFYEIRMGAPCSKYSDEIDNLYNGEPPPEDSKNYVVGNGD